MRRKTHLACDKGAPGPETWEPFTEVRRQYIKAVRILAIEKRPAAEVALEVRKLAHHFKSIMWCLQQDQKFRGKKINPLPPFHEEVKKLEPIMDDTTDREFKTLIVGVRGLISKKLQIKITEWEANNRVEDKPTLATVAEELVSSEQSL